MEYAHPELVQTLRFCEKAALPLMLIDIHIRITPEEHDLLLVPRNRSTLQLSDGTGYLIGLGVYHELHCLKWIRHWIHRDVYWPDLTGAALEERKWHIGRTPAGFE
jgi:hypothetical protein